MRVGRLAVDLRSREAWKDGEKLALPHQPLEILAALLEKPGEIVTREELRQRLWPDGTFVDFEHSVNAAVKKLRAALGDSAEEPQFVETLPRVGYRLVISPDMTAVRPRSRAALILSIVLVAGAAPLVWWSVRRAATAAGSEQLKIRRLTDRGDVVVAAISPDGKYLAYVASQLVRQSIRLKQIGTASETEIRPWVEAQFWGMSFSPDGKFIYHGLRTLNFRRGKLFRVPTLGGPSIEVLDDIDSAPAFSPDGSKIAFLRRNHPTPPESALLTANADGTNIRVISTRREPDFFAPVFFSRPSWSPDGRWIACSIRRRGGDASVVALSVDGSQEIRLSNHPWTFAGHVEWLPGGEGLLAVATDEWPPANPQIWFLPQPSGRPKRITLDLLPYRLVNLTSDQRSLLTIGMNSDVAVWHVPLSDPRRAAKLTNYRVYWGQGLTAASDGFLFGGGDGAQPTIWSASLDGAKRQPLLATEQPTHHPAIAPNGRDIAFLTGTDRGPILTFGRLDGSQFRRIAPAVWRTPAFTPDGKSVVFNARSQGREVLFKVPFEGGSAVKVTDYSSFSPSVSPDGTSVAARCSAGGEEGPFDLCLIPIDGGPPTRRFQVGRLAYPAVVWSADGQDVFITDVEGDAANVYAQPVDGSKRRRVTAFEDQTIFEVALADGGQSLLVIRGDLTRDAYLITGFRSIIESP
ncbi:MAG TPA: winged helix-turn-helix domain-containing protein [Thermoanaerobaculia bacterium]|nr:winged helix-turn-helix domain-containing protein [Thermoanaerobaculia bacterium]